MKSQPVVEFFDVMCPPGFLFFPTVFPTGSFFYPLILKDLSCPLNYEFYNYVKWFDRL